MGKIITFLKTISFKQKLITYSLLISISPVLLLGWTSSYIYTKSIQEEVDQNHQMVLKQIQYQINNFIKSINTSSILAASSSSIINSIKVGPSVGNLDETYEMITTLRKYKSLSLIKYNVSLIYKKFDYVYSNSYKSIPYTNSIYNDIIQSVNPVYNPFFIVSPNTFQNQDELLLVRPVPLHSYYTEGILVLHVSINELIRFLEQLTLDNYIKIYVIDDQGRIVISQDKGEIGEKLTATTDMFHFWKNPDGYHGDFMLNGIEYQLSAEKSWTNDWTYIAMTPIEELTGKSDYIKNLTWGLIIGLTLVWMLVSFVGSRRLYYPIERLLSKITSEYRGVNEDPDGIKTLDSFMHNMITTNKQLKSQLNEQRSYIKESFSHQLLRGELSDKEIRKKTEELNLSFNGNWFYVCLVTVDDLARFMQKKDRSLIHYALCKVMEEVCERIPCITLIPRQGQVAAIIGTDIVNDASNKMVRDKSSQYRLFVKRHFKFTVSVSISCARQNYKSISSSYQEVLDLLNYRLLKGHNVTISADEIKPSLKRSGRSMIKLQKNIVLNIIQGNLQEADHQLKQMIELVPRYAQSSESVLGLFSYLIGELDYLIFEMGFELNSLFEDDLYKQLYGLSTLSEVQEWLSETIFPIIKDKLESLNVSKQKRIIQHVSLYLTANFNTDLSLQKVADYFEISPSHLSRVFKEEMNMSYTDYLIDLRMNKAKEWLEHSDMPIKEIADRLSYSTVQNFSRVFRQIVGIPPGEYRSQYRNDKSPKSS